MWINSLRNYAKLFYVQSQVFHLVLCFVNNNFVAFVVVVVAVTVVFLVKRYSQTSIRRTPSGPASTVRLREVSVL